MKKFFALCLTMVLMLQMIPSAFAADVTANLFGEQVVPKNALSTLSATDLDGVVKTKDGTFLQETDDGNYIVLEENTVSFESEATLSQQLSNLNIPNDLKESILEKYKSLDSQGMTQGVTADIYIGTQKLNSNGRSFLDDYPTIEKYNRQFKVYPVRYNNLMADDRIYEGKATYNFMSQCTDLIASVLGSAEDIPGPQKIFLQVFDAGQTFLDWVEAQLDMEISGHTEDYHDFTMKYSCANYFYYLYSDTLEQWSRVLGTQCVSIEYIELFTYNYVRTSSNSWEGQENTILYENILLTTPSYSDPYNVAIQYQFSGLIEEMSFDYEGYTIYF